MQAVLIAALMSLLQKALPIGLKWLGDKFASLFDGWLTANPSTLSGLSAVEGMASDPSNVAAAPDALKEWLRTALTEFAERFDGRPLIQRAFKLIANFVIDNLADQLWDKLFPTALSGQLLAAPGGVHWSNAGAFESSLLAVQTDGRGTFTEAVLFPPEPTPEPEPAPAEGGTGPGPELVFDTPPVDPAGAPVTTDPAPAADPPAGGDF